MDRLVAMRTFALVVDNGSFAAVAKRLAVSAATVTHNVQLLEDYFDVRLLNRTTRKLSLTEIGRQFYDHCTRILAEIDEAERFVASSQATPSGLLRLNTSVWLANVMAPLIPEFNAIFPNVSFEVIMTNHMVDMVERGFDLAVRTAAGLESDQSSDWCRRGNAKRGAGLPRSPWHSRAADRSCQPQLSYLHPVPATLAPYWTGGRNRH